MMAHFRPRRAASLLNWAERYVFFVRAAAHADWQAMRRNQGLPLRVLLLRRLPASPPKRRRQSVVLYGIQGQTHPRALGATKADDHIRPRLRQLTPFS